MAYDLTGRRFGKLVAEVSLGMIKEGVKHRFWRCRCDCGAVLSVPQYKLTAPSESAKTASLACPDCQRRRCIVCNGAIPPTPHAGGAPRLTCSDVCRLIQKRETDRAFQQQKRQQRPEYDAELRRAKRAAMQSDPKLREHVRGLWRASNQRRRQTLTDEGLRRRSYRNRLAYQRRRGEWLTLTAEEKAQRLAALRAHRATRKDLIKQQRQRRRLIETPTQRERRMQADRRYHRERRRQQALLTLNATINKLLEQQDKDS